MRPDADAAASHSTLWRLRDVRWRSPAAGHDFGPCRGTPGLSPAAPTHAPITTTPGVYTLARFQRITSTHQSPSRLARCAACLTGRRSLPRNHRPYVALARQRSLLARRGDVR